MFGLKPKISREMLPFYDSLKDAYGDATEVEIYLEQEN